MIRTWRAWRTLVWLRGHRWYVRIELDANGVWFVLFGKAVAADGKDLADTILRAGRRARELQRATDGELRAMGVDV